MFCGTSFFNFLKICWNMWRATRFDLNVIFIKLAYLRRSKAKNRCIFIFQPANLALSKSQVARSWFLRSTNKHHNILKIPHWLWFLLLLKILLIKLMNLIHYICKIFNFKVTFLLFSFFRNQRIFCMCFRFFWRINFIIINSSLFYVFLQLFFKKIDYERLLILLEFLNLNAKSWVSFGR